MRNACYQWILATALAVLMAPSSALADSYCADLIAGQVDVAGTVCVAVNDDGDVCVTYNMDSTWVLDEYHLWIGDPTDADGFLDAHAP